MSSFKAWIRKEAIRFALRKPAPSSWLSELPGGTRIDFYSVFLEDECSNERIRVREINGFNIVGHRWGEEQYDTPTTLPTARLRSTRPEIWHFFKSARTEYHGALEFLLGRLTFRERRAILIETVSQGLYNSTRRLRSDRIRLLKALVDHHVSVSSNTPLHFIDNAEIRPFEMFQTLHGKRVWAHPDENAQYKRFLLLLESLAEEGDIQKTLNGYVVCGKAMKTISDFALEERRHRDSARSSWILVILTAVLAATAVLDAFLLSR